MWLWTCFILVLSGLKCGLCSESVEKRKRPPLLFFQYDHVVSQCPFDHRVVGNLELTAVYLRSFGGRMSPKCARILLIPFVSKKYVKDQNSCLAPEASFVMLDELAEMENYVLNLVDILKSSFQPKIQHGMEGLVILWQLDWLAHICWECGHSVEIVTAVLDAKVEILTEMESCSTYWRNIAQLGRIPFSLGVFTFAQELSSDTLDQAYNLRSYSWPETMKHVEEVISTSTDPPGRTIVRHLAETLPLLLFVKGRSWNFSNEDMFRKSCWVKVVHYWSRFPPNTQAQLVVQALTEQLKDTIYSLLAISTPSVRKMVYISVKNAYLNDKEQMMTFIDNISMSQYFLKEFLKYMGRPFSKVFGSQSPEPSNLLGQEDNYSLEYAGKVGKAVGTELVRFLLGEVERVDTLLVKFLLNEFDDKLAFPALIVRFKICLRQEFLERVHVAGRIVIKLFYQEMLFNEVIAMAVSNLAIPSSVIIRQFEGKMSEAFQISFITEWNTMFNDETTSTNASMLYDAAVKQIPMGLVGYKVDAESGKKTIDSLKLDYRILRPLAMYIALSNCKLIEEPDQEVLLSATLNTFVMSTWPIYELPADFDESVFTEGGIAIRPDQRSDLFFLQHQLIWGLKYMVHGLLEELKHHFEHQKHLSEVVFVKDQAEVIISLLLHEKSLERRTEQLLRMYRYNNNNSFINAQLFSKLISLLYPLSPADEQANSEMNVYRFFVRGYFVAMLSTNTSIRNNPEKIRDDERSLFDMDLSQIQSIVEPFPPNSVLKQIAAVCILSSNQKLTEEDGTYVDRVMVEDESKLIGYLKYLKIYNSVLNRFPLVAVTFMLALSPKVIHYLTLEMRPEQIEAIYSCAAHAINNVAEDQRIHLQRICFSLAVGTAFYDAVYPDVPIALGSKEEDDDYDIISMRILDLPRYIIENRGVMPNIKNPANIISSTPELKTEMKKLLRAPFQESSEVWDFLEALLGKPELGHVGIEFDDIHRNDLKKSKPMKFPERLPAITLDITDLVECRFASQMRKRDTNIQLELSPDLVKQMSTATEIKEAPAEILKERKKSKMRIFRNIGRVSTSRRAQTARVEVGKEKKTGESVSKLPLIAEAKQKMKPIEAKEDSKDPSTENVVKEEKVIKISIPEDHIQVDQSSKETDDKLTPERPSRFRKFKRPAKSSEETKTKADTKTAEVAKQEKPVENEITASSELSAAVETIAAAPSPETTSNADEVKAMNNEYLASTLKVRESSDAVTICDSDKSIAEEKLITDSKWNQIEKRNKKPKTKSSQESKQDKKSNLSKPIDMLFEFDAMGTGSPKKDLDREEVARIEKALQFGPPFPFCLSTPYYNRMSKRLRCMPKNKLWRFKSKAVVVRLEGSKNPKVSIEYIQRSIREMDEEAIGRLQSAIYYSTGQQTTDFTVVWNNSLTIKFSKGLFAVDRSLAFDKFIVFLEKLASIDSNKTPLPQTKRVRESEKKSSTKKARPTEKSKADLKNVAEREEIDTVSEKEPIEVKTEEILVARETEEEKNQSDFQSLSSAAHEQKEQSTNSDMSISESSSPTFSTSAIEESLLDDKEAAVEEVFPALEIPPIPEESELETNLINSEDRSSSLLRLSTKNSYDNANEGSMSEEESITIDSDSSPMRFYPYSPSPSPMPMPLYPPKPLGYANYQQPLGLHYTGNSFVPLHIIIWHPMKSVTPHNFKAVTINITRDNLSSTFGLLQNAILESNACAFDMEMSGLFPPEGGFASNFEMIASGVNMYQVVQFGLTCWRATIDGPQISVWSVMLREQGFAKMLLYEPKALQMITEHGFDQKVHEKEFCESFSFMNAIFPMLRSKPIIVHNGLADFLHLFKLGGQVSFADEVIFEKYLHASFVEFWDTKTLAVFGGCVPIKDSDLISLARRECGINFDERQAHEAAFDAFLTMRLWLSFKDLQVSHVNHRNILFMKR